MSLSKGVPPAGSGCQPTASAAEEASSRSGIPNAAPWWAGDNEEFYRVGPCRTRDEALGEAWAYFGDDQTIHLLQASLAVWSMPDASSVIDMMIDNSDELFFDEGFPGMDGTKDAVAEAETDLNRVLSLWLDKWRNIFPSPSSFGWFGERETVPASAIEAATADGTAQTGPAEGESAVGATSAETPKV